MNDTAQMTLTRPVSDSITTNTLTADPVTADVDAGSEIAKQTKQDQTRRSLERLGRWNGHKRVAPADALKAYLNPPLVNSPILEVADDEPNWGRYGQCRDSADVFTAEHNTDEEILDMRAMCGACPVLTQCGAYVKKVRVFGFAAGYTEAERNGTDVKVHSDDPSMADFDPSQAALLGLGGLHKKGNGTARRRAEAVVALVNAGKTAPEIARELGYTTRSVNRLLRDAAYRYGIIPIPQDGENTVPSRTTSASARARTAIVVELHKQGRTVLEIATELGCTPRSVNRLLRDARYRYNLLPIVDVVTLPETDQDSDIADESGTDDLMSAPELPTNATNAQKQAYADWLLANADKDNFTTAS